jgi:hypothetical protein
MGKLRLEPKTKPPVSDAQYDYYAGVLRDAQDAYVGNNVFYDLDEGESPRKVRKAMLYVGEKEGLDVRVRSARGAKSLVLKFESVKAAPAGGTRASASDARKRILNVLSASPVPLQKSVVVGRAGISTATWNLRIKELMEDGTVQKVGLGRQTAYSLKS